MAALTSAKISRAGVDTAGGAAAGGGDSFPNTGKEHVLIHNGGVGPVTVTFAIQAKIDGVATSTGKQVVVPAGGERIVGPFPKDLYNDTNDLVQITYSGVTSVTVAVLTAP